VCTKVRLVGNLELKGQRPLSRMRFLDLITVYIVLQLDRTRSMLHLHPRLDCFNGHLYMARPTHGRPTT